jgi:uncharacterized repeat protein (TIGR02543 family)
MVTKPDNPVLKGYDFQDWYFEPVFSQEHIWDFDNIVKGNMTLFAEWKPIEYTVLFNVNGNTDGSMELQIITYNRHTALMPSNFKKTGHIFAGWSNVQNPEPPSEHERYADRQFIVNLTDSPGTVTLWAQWIEIPVDGLSFIVSFDSMGGSYVRPQIIPAGDTAEPPAEEPARFGYEFVDWYDDEDLTSLYDFTSPVDDHIILYAKWDPITYQVLYDTPGADPPHPVLSIHTFGVSRNLASAPTRQGFKFWYWEADGNIYQDEQEVLDLISIQNGSITYITLKAVWRLAEFTVTFNLMGGGPPIDPVQVDRGDTISDPDADIDRVIKSNRLGHTLEGWYESLAHPDELWDFDKDEVFGNTTLYAKWEPIIYTVQYRPNGGGGEMFSHSYKFGIPEKLRTNPFTPLAGQIFAGWSLVFDGQVVYGNEATVYLPMHGDGEPLQLFAQWISALLNTFTVVYIGNEVMIKACGCWYTVGVRKNNCRL